MSPTDPAVVFSILGKREISGRAGTILEGESGANDPVGIALMVSLLGATGTGMDAVASGAGESVLQIVIGAAVGLAGGYGLSILVRRVSLPNEALYSLRTIARGWTSASRPSESCRDIAKSLAQPVAFEHVELEAGCPYVQCELEPRLCADLEPAASVVELIDTRDCRAKTRADLISRRRDPEDGTVPPRTDGDAL